MTDTETSMAEPTADRIILAEMTTDLVAAYVEKNYVRAIELPALIATVHAALAGLGAEPEPPAAPVKLEPPVSVRKSLTDDCLISMEDGKQYQSLKRHLAKRGLTPAQYRAKWGLPADYPMVAPNYARRRSELAKSIGLGNHRKAQ